MADDDGWVRELRDKKDSGRALPFTSLSPSLTDGEAANVLTGLRKVFEAHDAQSGPHGMKYLRNFPVSMPKDTLTLALDTQRVPDGFVWDALSKVKPAVAEDLFPNWTGEPKPDEGAAAAAAGGAAAAGAAAGGAGAGPSSVHPLDYAKFAKLGERARVVTRKPARETLDYHGVRTAVAKLYLPGAEAAHHVGHGGLVKMADGQYGMLSARHVLAEKDSSKNYVKTADGQYVPRALTADFSGEGLDNVAVDDDEGWLVAPVGERDWGVLPLLILDDDEQAALDTLFAWEFPRKELPGSSTPWNDKMTLYLVRQQGDPTELKATPVDDTEIKYTTETRGRVAPGDSGSPLVNADGRLVGVHTEDDFATRLTSAGGAGGAGGAGAAGGAGGAGSAGGGGGAAPGGTSSGATGSGGSGGDSASASPPADGGAGAGTAPSAGGSAGSGASSGGDAERLWNVAGTLEIRALRRRPSDPTTLQALEAVFKRLSNIGLGKAFNDLHALAKQLEEAKLDRLRPSYDLHRFDTGGAQTLATMSELMEAVPLILGWWVAYSTREDSPGLAAIVGGADNLKKIETEMGR